MGKDEGAGVLLEAAAVTYAKACEAWQAKHGSVDPEGRDELERAIAEARMQLISAAARFVRSTWTPTMLGELCAALGWQGGTIHDAIAEVRRLRERGERFVAVPDLCQALEYPGVLCVPLKNVKVGDLLAEVRRLRVSVTGLEGFKRSVDEALNSGDGSYRP